MRQPRRQATVDSVSGTRGTDDLVDAILMSSRALVAVSARSIAAARGVTLPQFRMLVVLEAGPTNLSGLAGVLDVAPSTAMRMVDRLVDAGTVQRTVLPDNRRETRLSLTQSGRRTVRTVTARRRRDLQAVVEKIPAERRAAVAAAMADFAEAADKIWPLRAAADPVTRGPAPTTAARGVGTRP